jgi:hypothetical protein
MLLQDPAHVAHTLTPAKALNQVTPPVSTRSVRLSRFRKPIYQPAPPPTSKFRTRAECHPITSIRKMPPPIRLAPSRERLSGMSGRGRVHKPSRVPPLSERRVNNAGREARGPAAAVGRGVLRGHAAAHGRHAGSWCGTAGGGVRVAQRSAGGAHGVYPGAPAGSLPSAITLAFNCTHQAHQFEWRSVALEAYIQGHRRLLTLSPL